MLLVEGLNLTWRQKWKILNLIKDHEILCGLYKDVREDFSLFGKLAVKIEDICISWKPASAAEKPQP
jgi:hypothetical protein